MKLLLKRAYEPAGKEDGTRVLVDLLWPRGVSKEKAKIDIWAKDVTPTPKLRTWFGHKPERWKEFSKKYKEELKGKKPELKALMQEIKKLGPKATLVYGAKDTKHTHALILKEALEKIK
jgi:uncharacterized protein YeaO (DUF488 family)